MGPQQVVDLTCQVVKLDCGERQLIRRELRRVLPFVRQFRHGLDELARQALVLDAFGAEHGSEPGPYRQSELELVLAAGVLVVVDESLDLLALSLGLLALSDDELLALFPDEPRLSVL